MKTERFVPGKVKKGGSRADNHRYSNTKLAARHAYNEAGENGLLFAKCMYRAGRKPLKQAAIYPPLLQRGIAALQSCITQRQGVKSKPKC